MKKTIQRILAVSFVGVLALMTGCNGNSNSNPCAPANGKNASSQMQQQAGQQKQHAQQAADATRSAAI
jgi:hypothetical protein